jgi:hypothetical protein
MLSKKVTILNHLSLENHSEFQLLSKGIKFSGLLFVPSQKVKYEQERKRQ